MQLLLAALVLEVVLRSDGLQGLTLTLLAQALDLGADTTRCIQHGRLEQLALVGALLGAGVRSNRHRCRCAGLL